MDLTVIIPTRNRRAIVGETLDRLEAQLPEVAFEAIVVDDGSTDGTIESLERRSEASPFPLRLISQQSLGPATGRNRALAAARAPVCLFIDDDTWPRPGLLARHRDFHARHPEPEAALLGFVDIAHDPPPSPFMLWLAGIHLGFDDIDPEDAGGDHFFSGNVSAKTAFVRDAGGFDEGFKSPASEDIDLGLRLASRGMRLRFDREAAVEHHHPTDLPGTVRRMIDIGRSRARLLERYPDREAPRRPGLRHRVKGGALTVLAAARISNPGLQRETWRFLCHEATREGYWDAVDAREGRRESLPTDIRIGRTLARLAARDADAQMPPSRDAAAGSERQVRAGVP